MTEEQKILTILQVTVSASTPLTLDVEIKILKLLGIITDPEQLRTIDTAASLVPPATPVTLYGLINLLTGLAKQNPRLTESHHDELKKALKTFETVADMPLTYGPFLSICEILMKARSEKK